MTDLTEQLKNGNLPEGEYYVENKNGNKSTMYLWSDAKCKFVVKEAELEILAPVPSYEEWKTAYECVVSENEEITTLKELLKECREKMFKAEKNYGFDDSIIEILTPQIEKINQVLGEDK